jgi:drug/metabolite transporter (DMT)-like permease
VFSTWQTYGVLVGGTLSFVLFQQALQAGDLVAAQPAITLINPLVALIWGFAVFGEHVDLGSWLAGAALGALAVVGGTIVLTRAALPSVTAAATNDQPSDTTGNA